MGKKKDVSPRKIAVAKAFLSEGQYTQQEIAKKTQLSQKTISRIKRSLEFNEEFGPHRQGKCGRKRILTPRSQRKLVAMSLKNRNATSTMLRDQLSDIGIEASAVTVRRRLCEAGLKGRRPRRKQKITAAMAKKRVEWAKNLRNWTSDDWSKVR